MMMMILRERADSHYLTVEARDERGRGNRNTVELVIRLNHLRHHFEHFRVNISIWWQNWWQADRFYNCQGGRCERQCPPVLERPVRVLPARELKRLWKPACYTSGRQGWKWSVKLAENFADTLVWSGTGNAMVRYRIVEGDTGGNFSIDSVTGEVGWTGMIMIDIKWLCSFRWKLLIWCLSYCHPCLAKTWNSLRITWILNQVRPTGALDYELIPGKGTEKVLDEILLDLRTNALTRWPPGLQHDRPSVRPGDTVTLLWCQCPHLYPRPERSGAKGVVLFFLSTIWIDAMISSVPNPQILGGHPGRHPWGHPCSAGKNKPNEML